MALERIKPIDQAGWNGPTDMHQDWGDKWKSNPDSPDRTQKGEPVFHQKMGGALAICWRPPSLVTFFGANAVQ